MRMHTESPAPPACCPVAHGWLILSYGLVEEGGDVLFLVPMGRTEHHHSILDRECIEVVQHDVVGLRKQRWITRDARVLVQDDLQQVRREDGRGLEPLLWFRDVRLLVVGSWGELDSSDTSEHFWESTIKASNTSKSVFFT